MLGGLWSPDIECRELFSIGSGYHKLFEVGQTELGGSWDIGAGKVRDVGGIDESSVCGLLATGWQRIGELGAYFCLKYNKELRRAAMPWRHCKYKAMSGRQIKNQDREAE